jgi:hypothetical protein
LKALLTPATILVRYYILSFLFFFRTQRLKALLTPDATSTTCCALFLSLKLFQIPTILAHNPDISMVAIQKPQARGFCCVWWEIVKFNSCISHSALPPLCL